MFIKDLVDFVLWLKSEGMELKDLDEAQLYKLGSAYWDRMHGED